MLASGLWAAAPSDAVSVGDQADPQSAVLNTGKLDPWRDKIDFRDVTLTVNGAPAALDSSGRYAARVPMPIPTRSRPAVLAFFSPRSP
jgi:hypothetical protein